MRKKREKNMEKIEKRGKKLKNKWQKIASTAILTGYKRQKNIYPLENRSSIVSNGKKIA